jgi:alkylation response protein AidB-like acyl-CoA dehydrogenase
VAHGGGGGSTMDVCVVAEELARGPLPVPFVGTVLGLELLELAGCAAVIESVLDTATGSVGLIVANDLCSLAGDGVAFDATAGEVAVGVKSGNVVLRPVGEVMDGLDLSRPVATTGHGDHEPLGALSSEAATRFEAFALVVLSAELVGAAEAALERAVTHVSTRKQFGRAVGSFQAVQHLCADALVLVESSRSIMWYAAWAVDAYEPNGALVAARTAKAYCAESALAVVEMAVQAFGGIGMTWEAGLHLLQRRVLFSRALLGNEYQHLEALADSVTGGPHGLS